MDQVWNILLGAGIASVVPIVTLLMNQRRWKSEKKIELVRLKHDRLEAMYTDILSQLGEAIPDGIWPSNVTSKVSVYGSKKVRDTYFDFIKDKSKDDLKKKIFYLDVSIACNEHLMEVQNELESVLK